MNYTKTLELAQCFVGEYGNYTIVGPQGQLAHLNGRLTLGENIADNARVVSRLWR
jgi:hypothetical protein